MRRIFSRFQPTELLLQIRTRLQNHGIPAWVFNKYVLVLVVFLSIILFFDSFNVIERYQLRAELRNSRAQQEYYEQEIAVIESKLDELMVNKETLEKFAREEYLMKKENEEVFVIVQE